MANCSLLNNEWKCSIIQSDYIQGTSLMQFRTILTTAALLEYYRDTLRSECKRDLVVSLFRKHFEPFYIHFSHLFFYYLRLHMFITNRQYIVVQNLL